MHHHAARRAALVIAILLGAFAANTYSFDDWAPVSAQQAQAHGASTSLPPFSSPQQVATNGSATAVPTPTATLAVPSPTDKVVLPTIAKPPDTPIGADSPTATPLAKVTPTPTPSVVLLAPTLDAIGTSATAVIGASGGKIVTADQRVTLDFPAGAVDRDADVSVMSGDPFDPKLPYSEDRPLLKRWTLDATDLADASRSLSPFTKPVTLTVRINPDELHGSNPKALRLWTLDATTNTWVAVPSILNPDTLTLVASLPHFTDYGLTGNQNVDMAPFSNLASVNLNSGAATLSIPIEVPAGPGGIKPDIALTYDSGRVDQMTSPISLGSWAGVGWNLNMGGISGDPAFANEALLALSLDAGGVSGKLTSTFGFPTTTWHLLNDPLANVEFLKASGGAGSVSYCATSACIWHVTVRGGTQYYFGEPAYNAYRKTWQGQSPSYRWDLSRVVRADGQEIHITYAQVLDSQSHAVDAHPSSISWGSFSVSFDVGPMSEYELANGMYLRQDDPRDVPCYTAPSMMETRRLRKITVTGGSTVRSYDLAYTTTAYTAFSCTTQLSGRMTLDSVTERGTGTPGTVFRTMTFNYADRTTSWSTSDVFTRPYLTKWNNGFGGSVAFEYGGGAGAPPANFYCGTVNAVSKKTVSSGATTLAAVPDVATTYGYGDGPHGETPGATPSSVTPCTPYWYGADNIGHLGFQGFGLVGETAVQSANASENVTTLHTYYASGTNYGGGTNDGDVMAGREHETKVSLNNVQLHRVVNTWNYTSSPPNQAVPQDYPRFVTLSLADETLQDNTTHLLTSYQYDAYGNRTQAHNEGIASTTADDTYTNTPYLASADLLVFVPQYESVVDGANNELRRKNFYYDGANNSSTPPTLGRLTAISTLVDTNPSTYSNVYMTYDPAGQVLKQSVATSLVPDTQTQGASTGWIPAGIAFEETSYQNGLPVTHSDALHHLTTIYYHPLFQKPNSTTDPAGRQIQATYDEFGRILAVWDNYDTLTPTTIYTYTWGVANTPNQTTITHRVHSGTSDVTSEESCVDGFGHEYEQALYQGTAIASVRIDYNNLGQKIVATNAVDVGTTIACPLALAATSGRDRTVFTYDALGNVETTTAAIGGQSTPPCPTTGTITYPRPCTWVTTNGLTTTTIDGNGHRVIRARHFGANPTGGDTSTVDEFTGTGQTGDPYVSYATTTSFTDVLGQLVNVRDAANHVTTLSYDFGGRKRTMSDPDMGVWSYTYDVAGNLTSQTDARGFTTTLIYDVLNRVQAKTYSNGDPRVWYRYDSYPDSTLCGQPASSAIGKVTLDYVGYGQDLPYNLHCYDLRGRETKTRTLVGNGLYDITRAFDDLGQVTDLTYPADSQGAVEQVHYSTTTQGQITGVCKWSGSACVAGGTYVSAATRTPWGATAALPLGNGQTTNYTYDERARLKTIVTGSAQNLALTYDDANNVKTVTDTTVAPTEVATYGYDELNRLLSASGFTQGAASYTYNTIGNMLTKQEGAANVSFLSVWPSHPHAPKWVVGAQPQAQLLYYDNNGNISSQFQGSTTTNIYTYDAENRMTRRGVTGGSMSYTYDANGTMVKRTNVDGSSTVYIGGIFEKTFNPAGNATGTTKYYSALGRTLAMRTEAGGAPTLTYLLADHLGTTVGTLDASGNVLSTQKYWPYGATRSSSGTSPTDKLYTGQQQELGDALGMYNYKARMYSTVTGRFVSADTVADSLNRYSYVANNPLRYVDPTGHCFTWGGERQPCNESDAKSWLTCGIVKGACNGDLLHMARWALGLREFYRNIKSLVSARAGFGDDVRQIRGVILGTSREMASSFRIYSAGEKGDKPNDSPDAKEGRPFPVTIDADGIRGRVAYRVDYSYLDFNVKAAFVMTDGDASKWFLALHLRPGTFDASGSWERSGSVEDPIQISRNESLFDGWYKELFFGVAPNPAAFDSPLLVDKIGSAHSGAITISMASWDRNEE